MSQLYLYLSKLVVKHSMNRVYSLITIFLLLATSEVFGQDTLPNFSVINPGNKNIIVSWINNYQEIKQLSIQRSFDSLKNYMTIISITDPNAKQNGFADSKAPNDHMFYRMFIVLGDGEYFFTEPKKPIVDSFAVVKVEVARILDQNKRPDFAPSFYVYTNRDGYVYVNLPDAEKKKYKIKFYEEDGTFLFELKNIKETGLTLDKANFVHAGWFNFELYNEEKLVEKSKFYLTREF